MTPRTNRTIASLLLAGALALTACSDDDDETPITDPAGGIDDTSVVDTGVGGTTPGSLPVETTPVGTIVDTTAAP